MLQTPNDPVNLPDAVKKEVEKVRDQLKISEIELRNIRKARTSEESFIAQLLKQKDEMKAEISKLEDTIAGFVEKKSTLEKQLSSLSSQNAGYTKSNTELIEEIRKNKVEVDSGMQELETEKENIRIAKEKLEIEKSEYSLKEKRLTGFIESVNKVIKDYAN